MLCVRIKLSQQKQSVSEGREEDTYSSGKRYRKKHQFYLRQKNMPNKLPHDSDSSLFSKSYLCPKDPRKSRPKLIKEDG